MKDSPAPMVILDKKLKILNHSDEWISEHCLNQKAILGSSIYELEQEIPKELSRTLEQCLLGEKSRNRGAKFILSSGNVVWLAWKINPLRNNDNEVVGLIVVLENVTKEKRKEELLIQAKKVARIGGWDVNLTTNGVSWTDMTREIHEMPKSYIPNLEDGINFYKEGEHRDTISLLVSEAISTGKPWNTESIIITDKGNEVWVRTKGETEIINGKCVRLFGTFQDINEQKMADLRFKEVSERLAIATRASGVGIWEFNMLNNTLIWDENMYKLYGIKKEEFSGVLKAWESAIHPDDKERMQKEVEMAINGEKGFRTEFRVIRSNGKIKYIKAEAMVQKNMHGEPIKMIGINWDITKIRKADLKLKKLYETTRQQNDGLTNFAYIVSHNLRSHATNLSMLSGYLVQAENNPSKLESEERKNIIEMISSGAESLNDTITHLNDVVMIRSDIKEKIEPISLHASLKVVLKNIGKLIEEQNATYTIELDKRIHINVVPAYLDSILLNLFTNSLRYAHPERQLRILISARTEDGKVILSFRDNGQGIDIERHGKKLFGLYKTFHNHKDSKGIGLFISKNQIEAMEGSISVNSVVGEWTEFTLHFQQS